MTKWLWRSLLGFAAVTALLVLGLHFHIGLSPQDAPPAAGRAWALSTLAGACSQAKPGPAPKALSGYRAAAPVVVELWREGQPFREEVGGRLLVDAVEAITDRLRADPDVCRHPGFASDGPTRVRFTVTVPLAEGPVFRAIPFLSALAVVPLREGLFVEADGRRAVFTPHRLWAKGVIDAGVGTPIPDLTFGMDVGGLIAELVGKLGVREAERVGRFRAVTWTEASYPGSPSDPDNAVTRRNLLAAAGEGVRFLLRHQRSDGRFTYIYDGQRDARLEGRKYNLPRHSGTAFFLAQAARVLGDERAARGAQRALRYLRRHAMTTCGAEDRLCIVEGPVSRLGASALAALAVAEWLRSHDGESERAMLAGLTRHLRAVQRPDGELMHDFDHAAGRPHDVQRMYYSGEAALALLTAHQVTGDPADLAAVERLMAHLTGSGWDFFGSRYFYGEEHWTCQAVAMADQHFHDEKALDFCLRWAAFQRAVQFGPGETPWDAAGAYGVGPLFLPRTTAIAARIEAAVPLFRQAKQRGLDTEALRGQIESSLGALLRLRWSNGPVHLLKNPLAAVGGIPATQASFQVRNDYVQHAGSAMLAWASLLPDTAR